MQPSKVLVIDESDMIHNLFRPMLGKTVLVTAADGREALRLLAEQPKTDLIFLDIDSSPVNGIGVLEKLLAAKGVTGIPVILVSSPGQEHDVIRGLQNGAAAYIKKPLRSEEVLGLSARLMQLYKPHGARASGPL
jgi:DNA-binding response OmpR family regulator